MKRLILLLALATLGVAAGTAFAAYVSTTSNGPNTFTTRAVPSKPVITGPRLTADPACGINAPVDTVRQSAAFYICAQSVTDPAGVSSVTADVTAITGNPSVPLMTSGGPFSGYDYRSAPQTANAPLDTGTTGSWSIKATNTNGDRSTLTGNVYNVRSYRGFLLGEFGMTATTSLSQYYRFSEATGTGLNLGTGGTAAMTYNGTPTRRVPGAILGETDTAVQLNTATDYLSGTRRVSGSDYSLGIWVKGSATSGSGPGTLFSDSAGLIDAGSAASANDFGVAIDATGRIIAGCGNGATTTLRTPAGALSDGNWHFVMFTRVRTTGAIKLYLDAVLADSKTTCQITAQTGSGTVWFGRSHESTLNLTATTLDEPTLFQRTLTPAEITDLYTLGNGTG